jgi:hypothetical protein
LLFVSGEDKVRAGEDVIFRQKRIDAVPRVWKTLVARVRGEKLGEVAKAPAGVHLMNDFSAKQKLKSALSDSHQLSPLAYPGYEY